MSRIDTLASLSPWTEEQFLCSCDEANTAEQSLVSECDGHLVGFVVYNSVLDEGSIHSIAVVPEHQRQGLAGDLLTAAFLAMKELGVCRCLLDVRESNAAAISLYSKLGFQSDGLRRNYYRSAEGREDAVLMSKLL